MACLHLLQHELACAVYVDTGYSYPETWKMVEYAQALIPVHVVSSDRQGQNAACGIPADLVPVEWTILGQAMHEKKPYAVQSFLSCCYENIALPAFSFAKSIGATHLVLGQRNDESYTATAKDGDRVDGIVRVHPLERWTAEQVLAYLGERMDVPPHYALTHSSLDCYDCSAYLPDTKDLWDWTEHHHPQFYARRRERRSAVIAAVHRTLEDMTW